MTLFRIRTLVLLQLGNKYNFAKKGRTALLFAIGIWIAAVSAVTLLMCGIFWIMQGSLGFELTKPLLSFLILISQVLSIIGCTGFMLKSLYASKDNPILLATPTEHDHVFISKLVVAYLNELRRNSLFLLPLMLAFGIMSARGGGFFVATIAFAFVLPLLVILIGALLSIPCMYIKKLFRKVPLLMPIFIFALLFALFVVTGFLLNKLPNPLRVVELYFTLISKLLAFMSNVSAYSLFYVWVSNILFGTNVLLSMLWLFLLCDILLFANTQISKPLFFSLASSTAENAVQKAHKGENKTSKSTYRTFLRKEVLLSIRNFSTTIEEYVLVIAMPFVLFVVNGFLNRMDLSSRGNAFVFGINLILGLIMITASNTASATALSKEGGEFVLLKTSPTKTYMVTWAKLTFNFVITTILLVASLILVGIMGVYQRTEMLFVTFAVFMIVNCAHIMWSFQLDLKNPQMREYAATGSSPDNKNTTKSITIGLLISLVIGLIATLLFLMIKSKTVVYLIVVGFSLALALIRLYMFNLNLKCLFEDLEF